MKIVVATHNKGKLAEFEKKFKGVFEVYSLPYNGYNGEIDETGKTFYENALLKAKDAYEHTGEICIADDSGLCVAALNGEPGVYSARYGGDCDQKTKNAMIINKLKNCSDRSAKFVCCLVMYGKNGVIAEGRGEVEGRILEREEGENGFGYDGIFFCNDLKKSFGLATDNEKNSVSHRNRAVNDLLENFKRISM